MSTLWQAGRNSRQAHRPTRPFCCSLNYQQPAAYPPSLKNGVGAPILAAFPLLARTPPALSHTLLQVLVARAGDNWIVSDLVADPFYRMLRYTYPLHAVLQAGVPTWRLKPHGQQAACWPAGLLAGRLPVSLAEPSSRLG